MQQKLKLVSIMKKIVFCLVMFGAALGLKAQSNEVTRETRTFSIIGKDTLKVDAYINPKAEVKPEGRPVVMYIHGGGWTMGSRVNAAQEIFCRYMAERGWLALSIDYRLAGVSANADGLVGKLIDLAGSNMVAVKTACSDVVDATNFVLQQKDWKANPAKFCLAGGSAGAMASLQTVYDFCNDEEYTKRLPKDFSYAGVISQAGCITLELGQQKLTWKRKPCPIMFFHGTEDNAMPLGVTDVDCRFVGTLSIVEQLEEMGVPYWKWIERGADHVMAMRTLTVYLEEQYHFLRDFVENGQQTCINTESKEKEPANMTSVDAMIKYVPFYILGYGRYLDQMDWNNMKKPESIVF